MFVKKFADGFLVELQQIFDLFGIRSLRVYPDTKFTIRIFVRWLITGVYSQNGLVT